MAEQEFELYLSLLSKLLRLKPDQRTEIADELRDHLEARMAELAEAGHSRAESIRVALEELGDAAGLASEFTHISAVRRRRFFMKCTIGSIAALTAAVLITAAMWPAQQNPAPNPLIAQDTPDKKSDDKKPDSAKPEAGSKDDVKAPKSKTLETSEQWRADVEAKLSQKVSVEFDNIPMSDAFSFLSETLQVEFVVDWRRIKEEGSFEPSTPVTLKINNSATARTVLDLVLDQATDGQFGFTIRDGFVYITRAEASFEVQVYNCRDLLEGVQPEDIPARGAMGGMMGGGGGGFFQVGSNPPAPSAGGGIPGAGGAAAPGGSIPGTPGAMMPPGGVAPNMGGGGSAPRTVTSAAGQALVDTIQSTILPETWNSSGGNASIGEFGGLLIVKQTQAAHRELKQLLEKMREASRLDEKMQPPKVGPPVPGAVAPPAEVRSR